MNEVALLQLMGLCVVGTGIVILLFIKAQFVRVIGFVVIVLGIFALVAFQGAAGVGEFRNGQYQVIMKRPLRTANAAQVTQFETGRSFRSHFSSGTAPMGKQAARWR